MIGDLQKLLDNGFGVLIERRGNVYVATGFRNKVIEISPQDNYPTGRDIDAGEAIITLASEAFRPKAMRRRKRKPDED